MHHEHAYEELTNKAADYRSQERNEARFVLKTKELGKMQ